MASRHGKICYVEIPAADVETSARFYERAFGWSVRRRGDGALAFDDATGEVSGTWVLGRAPASEPGFMIYVMVRDADAALRAVVAAGGEVVAPVTRQREAIARVRDPFGNVLGVYEEPGLA
jgi:predicted enzyme related to lactoylglutathione lyase